MLLNFLSALSLILFAPVFVLWLCSSLALGYFLPINPFDWEPFFRIILAGYTGITILFSALFTLNYTD